jgi:membrane protease YdiL (CAAX protease family)
MPFLAAYTIIVVVSNLLYIIYQLMISFYIGILQGRDALTDVNRLSQEIEDMMSQNILYLVTVASVLICGVVFGFWYYYETQGRPKIKLRIVFGRRNLVFFLILGIGCQFFFSGIMNMLQPIYPEYYEEYGKTIEGLLDSNILLVLLYTIVIAPICEELIFRGVTLYRANKVIPFLGANLLQAIFFGIYHGNIIQGIYAVVMGFMLGLVYRKYHTIYTSILLHMLINASSFSVMLFPSSTISFVIMTMIGLAGSVYAFLSLKLGK